MITFYSYTNDCCWRSKAGVLPTPTSYPQSPEEDVIHCLLSNCVCGLSEEPDVAVIWLYILACSGQSCFIPAVPRWFSIVSPCTHIHMPWFGWQMLRSPCGWSSKAGSSELMLCLEWRVNQHKEILGRNDYHLDEMTWVPAWNNLLRLIWYKTMDWLQRSELFYCSGPQFFTSKMRFWNWSCAKSTVAIKKNFF